MWKDREVKRSYQREWVRNRRKAWIDANGPCKVCGSDENLEVDHINPSEKSMDPAPLWSMSDNNPVKLAELSKCQVLCKSCHMKKTIRERAERKEAKLKEQELEQETV